MKILTSSEDDFLYARIIALLNEVKIAQGGSAIPPTLRRHKKIKEYLIEKQKARIRYIEDTYFDSDGLNQFAIENYHHNLQKRFTNTK